MQKKYIRGIAALSIIAITVAVFAYYLHAHPETITQIKHIELLLLIELLILYIGTILALGFVFLASLKAIGVRLPARESILITMYSSIVNFFGPLQSGPAFRAVYLKQKYAVKLKDYTFATLVYYAWYGMISIIFLLSSWLGWWLFGLVAIGLLVTIALYHSRWQLMMRLRQLPLAPIGLLGVATLLQLVLVAIIYYLELHSIVPGISFSQAVVYSGAANLALFVSITPGAIGFRESFLVFSQNLHHISNTTIVAANIIDRSVYIVLLLGLAIVIFGTHAQKRLLAVTKSKRT